MYVYMCYDLCKIIKQAFNKEYVESVLVNLYHNVNSSHPESIDIYTLIYILLNLFQQYLIVFILQVLYFSCSMHPLIFFFFSFWIAYKSNFLLNFFFPFFGSFLAWAEKHNCILVILSCILQPCPTCILVLIVCFEDTCTFSAYKVMSVHRHIYR